LPTEAERRRAARYRIKSWSRFDATDIEAVKVQLARGVPVIFNMLIGSRLASFRGDGVFSADEGAVDGHTMVVVSGAAGATTAMPGFLTISGGVAPRWGL
jgi:hypothetical protein